MAAIQIVRGEGASWHTLDWGQVLERWDEESIPSGDLVFAGQGYKKHAGDVLLFDYVTLFCDLSQLLVTAW